MAGGFDSYAAHHFPALRTASVLICALACFGYACSSMNRATPSAARDVLPVTEYIVRAFNRDMAVAVGCHRIRRRGPSVGVRALPEIRSGCAFVAGTLGESPLMLPVTSRVLSQSHSHPSVSTFRRARRAIRSGDLVRRLSRLFGGPGAGQHANSDPGGCEIGEGHRTSARRRGAGAGSRRPIRCRYYDRHRSLSRRTSHFDDQARTADHGASSGTADPASRADVDNQHQSDRQRLARNCH